MAGLLAPTMTRGHQDDLIPKVSQDNVIRSQMTNTYLRLFVTGRLHTTLT